MSGPVAPPDPARRWSWGRLGVALVAVLVLAAAVLAVTGHRRDRATSSPSAPATTAPAMTAPATDAGPPAVRTVPATSAGAVSAAQAIVAAEPVLVSGDQAAALRLVDLWVTPAARGAIDARFVSARAAFEAAAGGPYRFDVAVLAVRTGPAGLGRVTVDAWCAEAIFARNVPAYATYLTEHFRLVWQGGGWRLTSMSDSPGPSIATTGGTTPAAEAAAALAGFQAAPAPTAAAGAPTRGGGHAGS